MLMLFTNTCDTRLNEVIYSIGELEDEDFNGNNGEDYVSDKAKEEGFGCDKDYIMCKLLHKYSKSSRTIENVQNIVNEYCDYFFGLTNYYKDYQVEVTNVGSIVFIAVAYTIED